MNSNLTEKKFILPFILVSSLFFLWAIAHNLNDILITQFQKALALSRGQSGFIQFAFYIAYFIMALPAGFIMKKHGYKNGIIFGLALYALGAFLFYPAAELQVYGFFLFALFIIASGLTFLETAANPYIIVLGDPNSSERRLNFAQSFNGLGTIVGPAIGGIFIFSNNELAPDLNQLASTELEMFRTAEAKAVQMPYMVIGLFVLALAVLFFKTKMPEINEENEPVKQGAVRETTGQDKPDKNKNPAPAKSWHLLKNHTNLSWGIVAQFFYVGAQVCIWSYFIDYVLEAKPSLTEKEGAFYLSLSLGLFMCGRFSGTYLMKFIAPNRLMAIYSLICIALLSLIIMLPNHFGFPAILAISFFLSIMFPSIFALGIKGLGKNTKIGSSLLIMAIVGGAFFPPVMGFLADFTNIHLAFLVPVLCFMVIFSFSVHGYKVSHK